MCTPLIIWFPIKRRMILWETARVCFFPLLPLKVKLPVSCQHGQKQPNGLRCVPGPAICSHLVGWHRETNTRTNNTLKQLDTCHPSSFDIFYRENNQVTAASHTFFFIWSEALWWCLFLLFACPLESLIESTHFKRAVWYFTLQLVTYYLCFVLQLVCWLTKIYEVAQLHEV